MFKTLLCKTRLHLPHPPKLFYLSTQGPARVHLLWARQLLRDQNVLDNDRCEPEREPEFSVSKSCSLHFKRKELVSRVSREWKKKLRELRIPLFIWFFSIVFFFFAWWCFLSFISSSSICMTAVIGHILPAHGDMRLLQAWIDWPALLYRETELVFSSHVALGVAWILSACSIYHVVGTKAEKRDNGHLMKNVECTYCISTNGISYQLQIQTNSMSWWKKIMVFFFFFFFWSFHPSSIFAQLLRFIWPCKKKNSYLRKVFFF